MAIPRHARRVWAHWRTEKRTLRQGFVALLVSTAAAFVAGLVLGSITGTLEALPGLIILIPAAVGMRGTIFGAIGARLGTSIHVGLFEATLRRGGVLHRESWIGLVMTLSTSLYLAVLTKVLAPVFGLPVMPLIDLITISVVGAAIASVLILLVTISLSVMSFHREWDLDTVSTPMVTAVGDMITLPALFLATFLVRVPWLNAILAAVCVIVGVVAIIGAMVTNVKTMRRILLEMVGVVLLTPILDLLAGTVAQARLAEFAALPALLMLVPPFVSQAGALGGILSSRLSSKLQLGIITPRGRPETPAWVDAGLTLGFGFVVFLLIGVAGVVVSDVAGLAGPSSMAMIGGTLTGGMMATAIAIVTGYYLAIATKRFGLDPDNHGVPIITSAMDLAGIVCLLVGMGLFGVR